MTKEGDKMTILKLGYGDGLKGVVYSIDATGGTDSFSAYRLGEGELFVIDYVGMWGERMFLSPMPRRRQARGDGQAQPAVIASLERSLEENADVWAELSRY